MKYDPQSLQSYWMPFTSNRDFKSEPRIIERAEGVYCWDQNGHKIIDGSSGLFCVAAGHSRAEIAEAVHAQLKELSYSAPFQLGHPLSFELAARIAELAPPGIDRVFFTNSGSESVDTAMKIACAYHYARGEGQRQRFVSRERAYHGVNLGGVALSGMIKNRQAFGLGLPGVCHMRVICGFGRVGKAFGAQSFGVKPDIMTMAKAITNAAQPMGAVAVDEAVHQAILNAAPGKSIELFHGYTFGGHPGACAAGLATLDIYRKENLFERGEQMSGHFLDTMFQLQDLPAVTDVRGYGMMAGFDVAPGDVPGARGLEVQKKLFAAGLHIKMTGDSGIVAPPLISEREHIDEIGRILREVLS